MLSRLAVSKHLSFVLIGILLIVTIASRLKYQGSLYGFDFGVYQPDGAHYTFRTLSYLGFSDAEAANRVVDWYQRFSVDTHNLTPEALIPATNPSWGLSLPRVVYPLLSVIPVMLLGIPGMLFIPILSLVVLIFVIQLTAVKLGKKNLGLLICFLLLASPTLMRWMIANCTDSLLAGLFAIYMYLIFVKPPSLSRNLFTGLLILLTSFTRFCLPIWIALFLAGFIHDRMKRKAAFWVIISFVSSLPAVLMQPDGGSAFLPEQNDKSFIVKLIYLPLSYIKIAFIEIAELAVLDRLLLLLLIVGCYFSLRYRGSIESIFFISVSLSVWTLGALNGVLGVNFRYQLPLVPFLAWILLMGIPEVKLSDLRKVVR